MLHTHRALSGMHLYNRPVLLISEIKCRGLHMTVASRVPTHPGSARRISLYRKVKVNPRSNQG